MPCASKGPLQQAWFGVPTTPPVVKNIPKMFGQRHREQIRPMFSWPKPKVNFSPLPQSVNHFLRPKCLWDIMGLSHWHNLSSDVWLTFLLMFSCRFGVLAGTLLWLAGIALYCLVIRITKHIIIHQSVELKCCNDSSSSRSTIMAHCSSFTLDGPCASSSPTSASAAQHFWHVPEGQPANCQGLERRQPLSLR